MSDTFILKGSADMSQAETDVQAFIDGAETKTIPIGAKVDDVDTSALDDAIGAGDIPAIDVPVTATGAEEAATNVGKLKDNLGEIPVVGEALSGVADKLSGLGSAGETAAGAISGILTGAGALGLVSVAITGVSEAWDWYSKRAENARKKAEELAKAHRDVTDALEEGDISGAAAQLDNLYGDVIDQAHDAGGAFDEVTRFITGQADSVPSLVTQFSNLTDAQRALIPEYQQSGILLEGMTTAQMEAIIAADEHDQALQRTTDALADSRHQYAEQGDIIDVTTGKMEGIAEDLVAATDAEGDMADGTALTTDQLDEQRKILDEAKQGARDYAEAIGSVDFKAAELEGATTAMSAYSDTLFAAGNEAQDSSSALRDFAAAVEENGLTLDTTTEAGAAVQDALEKVAATVDQDLAQAFDRADGSLESFRAQSKGLGEQLRNRLVNDFNFTEEAADAVVTTLGLMDDQQIEARFTLAGAEEAKLQLQLLQGAIDGLPPEVEQQVRLQILQGDYVGARDTIATYYESNPTLLPLEPDAQDFPDAVGEIVDDIPAASIKLDPDAETFNTDVAAVGETIDPVQVPVEPDVASGPLWGTLFTPPPIKAPVEPDWSTVTASAAEQSFSVDVTMTPDWSDISADPPDAVSVDVNMTPDWSDISADPAAPVTVDVTMAPDWSDISADPPASVFVDVTMSPDWSDLSADPPPAQFADVTMSPDWSDISADPPPTVFADVSMEPDWSDLSADPPPAQFADVTMEPDWSDVSADPPSSVFVDVTMSPDWSDISADPPGFVSVDVSMEPDWSDISADPPPAVFADVSMVPDWSDINDVPAGTILVDVSMNPDWSDINDVPAGLIQADVSMVPDWSDLNDVPVEPAISATVDMQPDWSDLDEVPAEPRLVATVDMEIDTSDGNDTITTWMDARRETIVDVEADTSDGNDTLTTWIDTRRETIVDVEADTSDGTDTINTWTDQSRSTTVDVEADTAPASAAVTRFASQRRTTTVTANADTGAAEAELNHVARHRTATISIRTTGGGSANAAASRAASPSAAAAAPVAYATPAAANMTANVTVNAAVIGNPFDVMRAVTESTRRSLRIAGRRQLANAGGRNP